MFGGLQQGKSGAVLSASAVRSVLLLQCGGVKGNTAAADEERLAKCKSVAWGCAQRREGEGVFALRVTGRERSMARTRNNCEFVLISSRNWMSVCAMHALLATPAVIIAS